MSSFGLSRSSGRVDILSLTAAPQAKCVWHGNLTTGTPSGVAFKRVPNKQPYNQRFMETSKHAVATDSMLSGDRYRIIKQLGTGGMATVYLAHDNNSGCAASRSSFPMRDCWRIKDFLERFLQETRSLVNLRHPNILKIIDVGQHGELPFAVMDYLSGGSVNDQRFRDPQGNFIPVVPSFF